MKQRRLEDRKLFHSLVGKRSLTKEMTIIGMEIITIKSMQDYHPDPQRILFSATHDEILTGYTTDIYFLRTRELLKKAGVGDNRVFAEIFSSRAGCMAGMQEVYNLFRHKEVKLWGLPEGESFSKKEVVLQIEGKYSQIDIFETILLGILASSSAWATAARECREAAREKLLICFGARHIHPAVAPVMERASIIGGTDGASCILGAKLKGQDPIGTISHAAILMIGDTVRAANLYDEMMDPETPRIILVDTFKDEAEEVLRVANSLGKRLEGVRLDTPSERGGVTPALVSEVRARLDLAGYDYVKIVVSGGLNPTSIKELREAGAEAFGVGSYIAGASPINMTMDIKEVEGVPVAKRGRIPGRTKNERLQLLSGNNWK